MNKHCRLWSICIAHTIGMMAMFIALSAQAVTLGHSRVISLPNQPLRIMVQLKEVTASDLASLKVQVAPLSAWHEAGLIPPVDFSSLTAQLKPSSQPNTMHLWVQSPQLASENVLDILVDIKTATATQRHQVSVLQIQKPTPISLAAASISSATSTSISISTDMGSPALATVTVDQKNQVTIKKGQYLYQIARKLRSDQYNDQQLMAALVQANPSAFIHNNMNLLRSGVTLDVPAAEQVAAITPQQARQIYQTHLQHFDDYRQRMAKGQPVTSLPAIDKESEGDPTGQANSQIITTQTDSFTESKTDRLELSVESDDRSQADQAVSIQQELAYTSERLTELESINTTTSIKATADENAQDESMTQAVSHLNKTEPTEMIQPNTGSIAKSTSWLESNVLLIGLGLLLLMAILVALFLKAAHANQLNHTKK